MTPADALNFVLRCVSLENLSNTELNQYFVAVAELQQHLGIEQ